MNPRIRAVGCAEHREAHRSRLIPKGHKCASYRRHILRNTQPDKLCSKGSIACFPKKDTMPDMNNISIADILELPVQERIHLVELILG